jgi:hypothetical protein
MQQERFAAWMSVQQDLADKQRLSKTDEQHLQQHHPRHFMSPLGNAVAGGYVATYAIASGEGQIHVC